MEKLKNELENFRREEEAAQQHFFAYLALNNVPSENETVLNAMNETPILWLTLRYAALESTFMALGRIFDEGSKHNVNRLLSLVESHLDEFSRSALAARRISEGSMPPSAAQTYAQGKYEMTSRDVRTMRRAVKEARRIWHERYRDIRHKIHAHRGLEEAHEAEALYAQTNINEIVSLLGLLAALYEAIWQALNNGRAPDLTMQGPRFPVPDRVHRDYPGERIYLETAGMLSRLAGIG